MLIYLIAIFSVYFIFLGFLLVGLLRLKSSEHPKDSSERLVSVIVPFRNEADNLPALVASLAKQGYAQFEVIFVNDHSTDKSVVILNAELTRYPSLNGRVIDSAGEGKKQALATGISKSTVDILLTTDADCVLPKRWIEAMVSSFDSNTHLVVGTVGLKGHTFFERLQAQEFLSLIGSGLAMLRWGIPLMSNGASLGFTRRAFIEVNGYTGNEHIPSGDDEFLMHKIARKFSGSIKPVKNLSLVVITSAAPNLNTFLQQRIRWASKWEGNQSAWAKLIALLVLIVQVSWIMLLIMFIFSASIALGIILIAKIFLEFIFLFSVSTSLRQKFSFSSFLLLQVLYPVYVLWVGVAARFRKYSWKGRVHTGYG